MRTNVKPLTHWIIYRGYKVRFTQRTTTRVAGVLTTPTGELPFTYDPMSKTVQTEHEQIIINDYGWEMSKQHHA